MIDVDQTPVKIDILPSDSDRLTDSATCIEQKDEQCPPRLTLLVLIDIAQECIFLFLCKSTPYRLSPSAEKMAEAIELGLDLAPNQTLVDEYFTGGTAA